MYSQVAQVAKLVDASVLGADAFGVRVRVPPWAPSGLHLGRNTRGRGEMVDTLP
jgi:hypothetical protein